MRPPQRLLIARFMVVFTLLAASCTETGEHGPTAGPPGGGAGDDAEGGAAGGGPGAPPITLEHAGGYKPDDAWIFSDGTIHTIELTLSDASIAALNADPYTFAMGDVSFDGEPLPDVGVRLRGKIGSFRTLDKKPKFKLKFNEIHEDQRFYGLEELSLNNEVVDCTYLKEPLGYRLFALAGVPAERTGFARLLVNGAEYGLYVLVEVPDDRFLKRVFKEPKGNLYDGKYVWYGGANYTLLDFNAGVDDLFSLEEGVDVAHADIHAISDAVASWAGTGQLVTGLDPLLRWDEFHRMLAGEQWIGHNDGYALNRNNYRVYFHPEDGRAELVPWDLDYAFLHDSQWGLSWSSPPGKLAGECFKDAACALAHKAAVQALVDAVDPVKLIAWFDAVDTLTYDVAMTDPRRECAADQIAPLRKALRSWISGRNDAMRAFWGL